MNLDQPINKNWSHFFINIFLSPHVCRRYLVVVSDITLCNPQPVENLRCKLRTKLRITCLCHVNWINQFFLLVLQLLFECSQSLGLMILRSINGCHQWPLSWAYLIWFDIFILFIVISTVSLMLVYQWRLLPFFTIDTLTRFFFVGLQGNILRMSLGYVMIESRLSTSLTLSELMCLVLKVCRNHNLCEVSSLWTKLADFLWTTPWLHSMISWGNSSILT